MEIWGAPEEKSVWERTPLSQKHIGIFENYTMKIQSVWLAHISVMEVFGWWTHRAQNDREVDGGLQC